MTISSAFDTCLNSLLDRLTTAVDSCDGTDAVRVLGLIEHLAGALYATRLREHLITQGLARLAATRSGGIR